MSPGATDPSQPPGTPGDPSNPGEPSVPGNPGDPDPSGMMPVMPPGQPADPPGPGTIKPDDDPNLIPPSQLFTCTDQTPPGATEARWRMFNAGEWQIKTETRSGYNASLDPSPDNRYTTLSKEDMLNDSAVEQMIAVATRLAKEMITDKPPGDYSKCLSDSSKEAMDAGCRKQIVNYVTPKIWRTYPTDEDRALLDATFEKEFAQTKSNHDAAFLMVQQIVLDPRSLYRAEFGQSTPDEHGRRRLGAFELANALTYALSDGDMRSGGQRDAAKALWEAAKDQKLQTPEQVEAHVLALVWEEGKDKDTGEKTLEVGEKTKRFFREYYGFEESSAVFKEEPAATSRYSGSKSTGSAQFEKTANRANNLLDEQIRKIVRSDKDVFKQLMLLSTAPVRDGYMSRLYDLTDPETGMSVEGEEVDLSHQRRGVLTQPAWLMAHGHNRENDASLVYRGKWVLENILCGSVPAIPIDVAAVLPEEDWSARRRVAWATQPLPEDSPERKKEKEYCWQCHKLMNPLGEPFEIYNHAGYMRSKDHGAPPDGSSTLIQTGDPALDGVKVTDALDLMENLATSQVAQQCFVRQTFRFYMGRAETPADACALSQMMAAYLDHDGSFVKMLVALFKSDSFLYRYDKTIETTDDTEKEGY